MVAFLTSAPLWVSGILLVGLGTVLSMLGPVVVRRYVKLEKLAVNNEVAGFKFATVGVLYAVLLAFSVIVVWQKYSDAEVTVMKEGGAAAALYHLANGLDKPQGAALSKALTGYLESAISDEWPAMERGVASHKTWEHLNAIYATLLTPNSAAPRNTAVMPEIFSQLDVLTQTRRVRLAAAEGAIPGVLWAVLFGGAVVTIVFTFFFGTKNLRAQVLMAGMLAILILSELLITVVIDKPFTGSIKVSPEPLAVILTDFVGVKMGE